MKEKKKNTPVEQSSGGAAICLNRFRGLGGQEREIGRHRNMRTSISANDRKEPSTQHSPLWDESLGPQEAPTHYPPPKSRNCAESAAQTNVHIQAVLHCVVSDFRV